MQRSGPFLFCSFGERPGNIGWLMVLDEGFGIIWRPGMGSHLEHTRSYVGKFFNTDGTAPGMVWESKMLPDSFFKRF